MSHYDILRIREEVLNLCEAFRTLPPSTIRSVLDSWIDRRPIEERLEVMEKVLSSFKFLKETVESIVKYLRNRDWRGCIVAVVGDYGAGKTQMGLMMQRKIRESGEAEAKIVTLSPKLDLRALFLEELECEGKPAVLIVDEVDQLMVEFRRGRREGIEELADLTRMMTEGSYSNPARGSVILLLSNKAYYEIRNDRALENRLMARARIFSLSMSESERVKASQEAVRKLIALSMAYNHDHYLRIHQHFSIIYPCLENLALSLSETHEIGGVVKNLAFALLEEILPSYSEARALGPAEEGRFFEGLIKRFLKEVGSLNVKVSFGEDTREYLARFSEEPLSVPGARTDAHYQVWTYDPQRGIRGNLLVKQVGVEVKYGEHWMERKDQLLKIMEAHPLLLILISDIDQEYVSDLKVEMRAGGRAFDVLLINPHIIRVTEVMDDAGALRFLRNWANLERDLNEALRILLTQSLRVKEREVSDQELLAQASSSIVSSLLRELRKAKTWMRTSTLSGLIERAVQGVYRSYNKSPPELSEQLVFRIMRIMEREGLGKMSDTGKSFSLDKEAKRRIEELSSDEARRMLEKVVLDELSRYWEQTLKLDA